MTKPRALDLFCCSGGSTTGLERAGFDVIGIDHKPSQHWTGSGELHEADLSTAEAVESVIRAFAPDFVSASPPCQAFSAVTPAASRSRHANLIPAVRDGLRRVGVPGWIENVHGAPLHHAVRLCGSMFHETQRIRRHRFFELIGWFTFEPTHDACVFEEPAVQPCGHGVPGRMYRQRVTIAGRGANGGNPARETPEKYAARMARNNAGPECVNYREALGWIEGPKDRYSLAQAIPPAYAEFLGRRFLETRKAVSP